MKQLHGCNANIRAVLQANAHCFVGYITAGYPEREEFFRILKECENNGMPIVEIGFPSTNPFADGDFIKRAQSSIDHSISHDMEFWRRLRASIQSPIWLMGYREELIDNGIYYNLAKERLIDALVIPNMDIHKRLDLQSEMVPFHVDVLGFTGDNKSDIENELTFEKFPLIYQQLYSGPTGVQNNSDEYLSLLTKAKKLAKGYVFAGFGIGTTERAKELLINGFDGVIIGTAIMKKLEQSKSELFQFIRELESAVKGVE